MSEPNAADTRRDTVRASAWYSGYALTVLFVVYVFNFIDRSILNILAQSIKEDLKLYDWQIGLMGGFAFAAFYTTLGIPIAHLADTHNRRNIVVVCLLARLRRHLFVAGRRLPQAEHRTVRIGAHGIRSGFVRVTLAHLAA